jgi:phosphoribosylamine--glycine ligase
MGDPETQSVLPRMDVDFLELMIAVGEQKLDQIRVYTRPQFATTVVSVSGGYPGEFNKGYPIQMPHVPNEPETYFFHGGTQLDNGVLRTSGGRVISTTSLGNTLPEALKKANAACSTIAFSRKYFRKDIGLDLWNF